MRFLNHYLSKHIKPVSNLKKDFANGVVLCRYVEYLVEKVRACRREISEPLRRARAPSIQQCVHEADMLCMLTCAIAWVVVLLAWPACHREISRRTPSRRARRKPSPI